MNLFLPKKSSFLEEIIKELLLLDIASELVLYVDESNVSSKNVFCSDFKIFKSQKKFLRMRTYLI